MLMPKRVKHRKQFRGSMAGKANRGTAITYGDWGLAATEPCWIKSTQIEAARVAETRMGSGKGTTEYWVAVVRPGRVMFEMAGVPEEVAKEALRLASHKLPCKCKVIARQEAEGGDNSEE